MLKCCVCNQLIVPNIIYEESEEIEYSVCEKCDITELTPEQIVLFEKTVNKHYFPAMGVLWKYFKTTKFVPVPETFDDKYASVDV
jgi:hypothetical protein